MSEAIERLLDEVRRRLPRSAKQPSSLPPRLTVGVEHELFVLGPDGPCGHEESQALFERLAEHGWTRRFDPATRLVTGVYSHLGGGGPAWVKYEYDPHLIEISTPYASSIEEMSRLLAAIWEPLDSVAGRLGLCLASQPLLDGPDRSDLARKRRIQSSRDLLQLRRQRLLDQGSDPLLAGFPAWTAATQTHIGGLPWFANPRIVDALYRAEPEVGLAGYRAFGETARDVFRRRWEGYSEVYGTTPLMGFPDFADGWSLRAWAGAMFAAPVAGGPPGTADATPTIVPGASPVAWDSFLQRVRDLQLIKPRLSGTLEFRGDPAQPDLRSIAKVAEARWNCCHEHLAGRISDMTYQQARCAWLSGGWLG